MRWVCPFSVSYYVTTSTILAGRAETGLSSTKKTWLMGLPRSQAAKVWNSAGLKMGIFPPVHTHTLPGNV